MEFQTQPLGVPLKNLYPCLATITVVPHGTDTRSRRMSGGSAEADDNALRRVISGGRRKTSFGVVADRGDRADDARRKSFSGGGGGEENGKWYWRVQAGATENQLVLLPLTQPANPVLTAPPQPLSHAMPQHSQSASQARGSMPGGANEHTSSSGEHEGIGAKIMHFFRRGSGANDDKHAADSHTSGSQGVTHSGTENPSHSSDTGSQGTATTATAVEHVIDQTPQGEMLPTAGANAMGATNLNANAETGWPGIIQGQPLQGIIVDLRSVDKSKVTLGGGKRGEGNWVTVNVSGNATTGIESVGQNHFSSPKSGTIKFEFDKDWIGGKGEAELLHYHITTAIDNLAQMRSTRTPERHLPEGGNFQLGSGNAAVGHFGEHGTSHNHDGYGGEVAPDQRVSA